MTVLVSIAFIVFATTLVSCNPVDDDSTAASTPVPIISQTSSFSEDGSYDFGYETGNGIKVEESGSEEPDPNAEPGKDDVILVLRGTYTYTAPDGSQIILRYVADENGFQPEGEHLPTPPSIPEEIQNSLNLQQSTQETFTSKDTDY